MKNVDGKYTEYIVWFENLNHLQLVLCVYCQGNISSRFSSNTEAFASELLENLEEMLPLQPVV